MKSKQQSRKQILLNEQKSPFFFFFFWLTKAATYKTPAFHDKSFYVKKLILEQV